MQIWTRLTTGGGDEPLVTNQQNCLAVLVIEPKWQPNVKVWVWSPTGEVSKWIVHCRHPHFVVHSPAKFHMEVTH